jgi:hypothetical protein
MISNLRAETKKALVTPSCYARFEVWVVRCGTCLIAAAVLG